MLTAFLVNGLNPASGTMVRMVLMARDASQARAQAEACGLQFVTLTPHDIDGAPDVSGRRMLQPRKTPGARARRRPMPPTGN